MDSYVVYNADGSTATFTVPFEYLEQSDVVVQVNGVPMLTPDAYLWLNAGAIQFNTKTGLAGATVYIGRQTSPDSTLVSFNNGAVLTAADLNTSALQCFYRTQELQDQLDTYIGAGVARYSLTGANPFVAPSDLINAAADAVLQTSLATTLLAAMTDIATNAASILTNTNQISTLQATLDSLTSGVPGGIGAYLTNETNSRIAGDAALAGTFALMGAISGGGATFTLDTATVYVDSVTSMADKFTALLSSIAGNTASITSEATTRAAADSATAATVATLSTTVAGNTASISTQATSISGLEAQYVVKIDVDGNVSGYGLASGGGTSQFTVLANQFSVIDPGNPGGSPTVPFSISGGVVYMANVVIGGALIEDLTIGTGKLAASAVTEFNSATQGATVSSTGTIVSVTFTPTEAGDLILMATGSATNILPSGVSWPSVAFEVIQGSTNFFTIGAYIESAGSVALMDHAAGIVAGTPVTVKFYLTVTNTCYISGGRLVVQFVKK